MDTGFQLRAPWYVRERDHLSLQNAKARRPSIQMYDDSTFVERLLKDPRDSLKTGADDQWSYPVPVALSSGVKGRERFATSTLLTTGLRKLYQPGHDRFYALVVEVFCDQSGLPRAGSHEDLEVRFVMRRRFTSVTGNKRPVRQLARNVLVDLAKTQHRTVVTKGLPRDLPDVFWADDAARLRFEEDNAKLLNEVRFHADNQAWITGPGGSGWRTVGPLGKDEKEEDFPMWRLPPAEVGDCEAAHTRSLWFGVIPTFSPTHWVDSTKKTLPKLDEHAVYELLCFVRQKQDAARKCPTEASWGEATEPFRLAAPYDPDGTKNHTTSVTLPDFRRLAARAGSPQGQGGMRVTTPPGSALPPPSLKDVTDGKRQDVGPGGSVCTFAIELFFIVAFFLFMLFLPIVVFIFQLWWMLALRFCFPPSASFGILTDFFLAGNSLPDLAKPANKATKDRVNKLLGSPEGVDLLIKDPKFAAKPELFEELIAGMDPAKNTVTPAPPVSEEKPDDPMCGQS
ncbi:hypothetical protein [Pseudarthrobacter sulfonivorans]|uniref:hypothetical protein n=1 Tax=Pseudarthrobacter sulfonivorans TaxID=121292 RepID=UPI002105DFF6|nr:hypothetical protein [Pseudarthrobacter sulfonivorans]